MFKIMRLSYGVKSEHRKARDSMDCYRAYHLTLYDRETFKNEPTKSDDFIFSFYDSKVFLVAIEFFVFFFLVFL